MADTQPPLRADREAVVTSAGRTVAGGHSPRDGRTTRTVDTGHGRRQPRILTIGRVLSLAPAQASPAPLRACNRAEWGIDHGWTARRPGYAISQRIRKRVEEIFGWVKTIGGGRTLRYIGLERNQFWAELTTAAYNLVRMASIEVSSRAIAEPASA